MGILKEQHETFANFFCQPTREALREVLRKNIGETDYLDFKSAWPETPKLARHILAIANSGGGAIMVGVTQDKNGCLTASGVTYVQDKATLIPPLSAYLPKSIEYQILDFSYSASEYALLVGKSFQVLLVEDTPKQLPYLSLRDGDGVRANAVYVRSGTASSEATHLQLQEIINRRVATGHSNQPMLDLEKHLAQLRMIDEWRPNNDCWLNQYIREVEGRYEDKESTDFKEFIEEIYEIKKATVLTLLGLAIPDYFSSTRR